jgi:hypothetical protein
MGDQEGGDRSATLPSSSTNAEAIKLQFQLEIEQHQSLRAEILRCLEDANQVLTFGLASVGIVYSAGLAASGKLLGFFLLTALGPAISVLTLSMWCSAQERLARAGYFLSGIEVRLKTLAGAKAETWEEWLRRPPEDGRETEHLWAPEATTYVLTYSLAIGSIVLGLLARPPVPLVVQLGLLAAVVLALVFAALNLRRRFAFLRQRLGMTYSGTGLHPAAPPLP